MNKLKFFKKTAFEDRGDTLEARIRDYMGNYYFKGKALIRDEKQMRRLLEDLRAKGVVLPAGWFD